MKKKLLIVSYLMSVCGFSGASAALLPGAAASMGVTPELLKFSPFTSFVIPGIFLLLVFGFGNLLFATLVLLQRPTFLYGLLLEGIVLLLWLMVQSLMLQLIAVPHVIFFFVSLLQIYQALVVITNEQVPLPFQAYQH